MPPKRKDPRTSSPSETSVQRKKLCIIHVDGIKHGTFTDFSNLRNQNERLEELKNIRDRRLAEPLTSPYRMTEVSQDIPDEIVEGQGYHRGCYQRFTMNLQRLKSLTPTDEPSSQSRTKRRASSEDIIFDTDCIFCNKAGRIHVTESGVRTTQATSFFERDGWKNVLETAEEKGDEPLLRRIRGYDLFACEAKYHSKCRKQYMAKHEYWRSTDCSSISEQLEMQNVHDQCFKHVAKYVDENVVGKHNVVQLSSLRLLYVEKLQETKFSSEEYRSSKLKKRLENHPILGPKIRFSKIDSHEN